MRGAGTRVQRRNGGRAVRRESVRRKGRVAPPPGAVVGELTCGVTGSDGRSTGGRIPGSHGRRAGRSARRYLLWYGHVLVARVGGRGAARAGRDAGGRLGAPWAPSAPSGPGRRSDSAARAAAGRGAEAAPGASAAAGGDLVGEGSVRGRARGEGPTVSGAGRAGRTGDRREDHEQVPRRAGRGDSVAGRVPSAMPMGGRASWRRMSCARCPCGSFGGGWGWWIRSFGTRSATWPAETVARPAAPTRPVPNLGAPPPSPHRPERPRPQTPDGLELLGARGTARPTPTGPQPKDHPSGSGAEPQEGTGQGRRGETHPRRRPCGLRPELALEGFDGFFCGRGGVDARRQVLPAAVGDDEGDVGGLPAASAFLPTPIAACSAAPVETPAKMPSCWRSSHGCG